VPRSLYDPTLHEFHVIFSEAELHRVLSALGPPAQRAIQQYAAWTPETRDAIGAIVRAAFGLIVQPKR